MDKNDKKGQKGKPLKERVLKADTYGDLKERLAESPTLQGIEHHHNGSTRFHGPTGMVSVRGADHHPVKYGTKKQIVMLCIKAGLLTITVLVVLLLVL